MDVYNGSSSEGDDGDLPQFVGSIDGTILDSEFVLQPTKMTQSFQPGMGPLVHSTQFYQPEMEPVQMTQSFQPGMRTLVQSLDLRDNR